jgi:hypothetical protein
MVFLKWADFDGENGDALGRALAIGQRLEKGDVLWGTLPRDAPLFCRNVDEITFDFFLNELAVSVPVYVQFFVKPVMFVGPAVTAEINSGRGEYFVDARL